MSITGGRRPEVSQDYSSEVFKTNKGGHSSYNEKRPTKVLKKERNQKSLN